MRCPPWRLTGIVGAAALAAVACPPHEWWLAAWAAPGLLLAAVTGLSAKRAWMAGLLFGVLLGSAVTPWVPGAVAVYFDSNPWAAGAFSAVAWAVFPGLPCSLLTVVYALAVRRLPVAARPPVAASLWVGMEWLRATQFSGMPWELLGHSQFAILPVVQIADLGGVYAVSFTMALVSTAIIGTVVERVGDAPPARPTLARRLVLPAVLLAAVLTYGRHAEAVYGEPPNADGLRIGIVQGNIANAFRWKREFLQAALATYVGLSTQVRGTDLIVWPENAINFYLDREPTFRALLATVAGSSRDGLLVGGPRQAGVGVQEVHSSAYLLDRSGRVRDVYDKRRLVPFAEYNPLPEGWARSAEGEPRYVPGTREDPLLAPASATALGTLICYEVLFPELARDLVSRGAEVLVNISNDAWLDAGNGAAPRQHFSMAVFRAIETRRYLVRASASGVSGFVAPTGRPYATLASGRAGTLVAAVERRSDHTPYVRWGDDWILFAVAASAVTVARASASGNRA